MKNRHHNPPDTGLFHEGVRKDKPIPKIETEVCKAQKEIAGYFAALHDDLQKILAVLNQIKERVK